jgi:acyl-[acyl-carrier-protein]-phospholipid O-acyltransferase / long-chain-fatty-acid--[acyl-carrier-protein] ligase
MHDATPTHETTLDHRPGRETTCDDGPSRGNIGFWSLIVTQFQGAFNDNALKFLVIYLIVDLGLPQRERDWLVLVVGALFAIPFILFSMTGGFLADRYSKRSVTIGTKVLEVGAMTFALVALARGSFLLETIGVFIVSSQAALFGPSKYGLLPEILPEKDLSWGNGIIELGTFLAAITATVASGFLAFYFRGKQEWSGVLLLGCTIAGLAASLGITRVPAANPARKFNLNPLGDLFEQFGVIRADPVLRWAFVGNMYLWFLAALLQFTIVVYGHDVLRIDERHISYLQAAVAIGIGTGALVTGYLSSGKIEYGLIPLGAMGMTVFGFLSAGQGLSLGRVAWYLGLVGFFGGFYAVPLQALIQHRPDPARKGGVIAAANLVSFVGVFLAAGVYFLLAENLHLRADKIFFAGACMTLAATFYAVVLLPDSLLRLALWTLTHTLYRIRVQGRDNIPERRGALFVTGHLTLLDALLLSASTDRRIRFLTGGASRVRGPAFVERVLRIATFPIQGSLRDVDSGRADNGDAGKAGPGNSTGHSKNGSKNVTAQRMEQLRAMIVAAFDADEVVCLAGDESIALLTSDNPGRKSLDNLMLEAKAPIVLVSLADTEGGALCGEAGRLFWEKPAHIPCKVTVRFRSPLPPALRPAELRRAFATFTSENVSHHPAQSIPAARS